MNALTLTKQSSLILGTAAIKSAILTVQTSGKRLDDLIQTVGLSVLNHVELHGDVTVVNSLYLSMPKGSRSKALAEWLMAHGKVVANTDRKAAKTAPFVFEKSKATKLDAAMQAPWFTFAPEPAVVDMFDFQAALKSLLARAEKAEKAGQKIEGADLLTKVRSASV
jgi:hypothetical protein